MAATPLAVRVGDRIDVQGYRATVRFVGTLEGLKVPKCEEYWLGVEWDDVTRGKNSGAVSGKQVFEVDTPGAGSFVRYLAVEKDLNRRRTILDVLKDRYVVSQKETNEVIEIDVGQRSLSSSQSATATTSTTTSSSPSHSVSDQEAMGIISSLDVMDVTDCLVAYLDLPKQFDNVKQVNLTENLVGDWGSIQKMILHTPNLTILNLSKNRFIPAAKKSAAKTGDVEQRDEGSALKGGHSSLEVLVLNDCALTWSGIEEMADVLSPLPSLHQLHLAKNVLSTNLTYSPSISALLQSVEVLDLSMNNLSRWEDVFTGLGNMPSLNTLYLSSNKLPDISWEVVKTYLPETAADGTAKSAHAQSPFPRLSTLSLLSNQIASFSTIHFLSMFHNLTNLRIEPHTQQSTPTSSGLGIFALKSRSASALRLLVAALLPKLTTLNNSEIEQIEAEESEKYGQKWLSLFLSEARELKKRRDVDAHIQWGPAEEWCLKRSELLYTDLVQKIGELKIDKKEVELSLKDSIITLRLWSELNPVPCEGASYQLPTSTTILSLRAMCAKEYKMPLKNIALLIAPLDDDMTGQNAQSPAAHSKKQLRHLDILDDDHATLAFYDPSPICRLVVRLTSKFPIASMRHTTKNQK